MRMSKLSSLMLPLFLIAGTCVESQSGSWVVLKTKNKAPDCSECGLATVDNKLYLIGGDGGGPKAVECFDAQTLTWTKLAEAPVVMHHFQAVGLNGKVYVLDAFSGGGFPDQTPMSDVYSYDIKNKVWEKGGEVPASRRRAGAGAVAYQGKLYLVAGIQHGHSSGTTNMFDVYDPQMKSWTTLPDAPHIRDHCSAAVVKDKLYVVGGRNTSFRDPENKITFFSQTVLDVDCFDFSSGRWSTLSSKLPLGSGGGAVVNSGDVLYYMGGERETITERNAPRKNTYYLNPEKDDQWKETDSLHHSRNGMAAATLNGKIYVAGGSGGGPGGPPPGSNRNGMPPGFDPSRPPGDSSNRGNMPPPPNGNNMGAHNQIVLEVFTQANK